jgi:PIN domain
VAISLIIDTCAFLDLIRTPARNQFHPAYGARARELLSMLQSATPPAVIYCTDITREEYNRHVGDVTADTERALSTVRDNYRDALKRTGGLTGRQVPPFVDDAWIAEVVQQARRIADDFFSIAVTEITTVDDRNAAFSRVLTATAPSKRGKDSLMDCSITEVALRIARAGQGQHSAIFFSSNVNDYCAGGSLHPLLESEFAACQLEYVRNWGEACNAVLELAGRAAA